MALFRSPLISLPREEMTVTAMKTIQGRRGEERIKIHPLQNMKRRKGNVGGDPPIETEMDTLSIRVRAREVESRITARALRVAPKRAMTCGLRIRLEGN